MSRERGGRLKAIREAEELSQAKFAELTGINIGVIKNYEGGRTGVGVSVIDRILETRDFKKYMMWLMSDDIAPEVGQISPALSPDGSESISTRQSAKKAG